MCSEHLLYKKLYDMSQKKKKMYQKELSGQRRFYPRILPGQVQLFPRWLYVQSETQKREQRRGQHVEVI